MMNCAQLPGYEEETPGTGFTAFFFKNEYFSGTSIKIH